MDVAKVHEGKAGTSVVIPYQGRDAAKVGQSSTEAQKHNESRQWTIKGLSPDTVEVSRDAARRSGMKLNSWVGQALHRAAEMPRDPACERDDARESSADMKAIREEIQKLRAQGDALEQTVNSMSALLLKLYVSKP